MKNATKMCGHCKRGEIKGVPAVVQVRGKNRDGHFVRKAYLCHDHLSVETQDGAEYQVTVLVQSISTDELTRRNTGYETFAKLCQNNPTLRPINEEMRRLRAEFEQATGRRAAC